MEIIEFRIRQKVDHLLKRHGVDALIQAKQVQVLIPLYSKDRKFWNEVVLRLEVSKKLEVLI